MNKSKLKTYAPQARKDFIAAVTARANLLGLSEAGGKLEVAPGGRKGDLAIIAGREWPAKVYEQRDRLIKHIKTVGFSQTMEAVAYTWFNRFAALRYMEIHDYLDHGHRVLSNRAGGMPEILNHATDLEMPGFNNAMAVELKLAGNKDGELYKMVLVAQCNTLSKSMPFLFERIDDETELLLADNLLRTDSIIAKLVEAIPEEDWQEVEIIGWLYQFYISEKKDEVMGSMVKSEDIPAATQLFTPNWIVQYLVQNSVGRLWLMANPGSTLQRLWPYYIQPAEQSPEVQAQLDALIQTRMSEDGGSLNPETITVLDPACGSGHILVVAYDVLKAIYLERGYQLRAIPRLILEKNLYGLDIDQRAAQLTGFALLMKGRADDRRLFERGVKLNVMALVDSTGFDAAGLADEGVGYGLKPGDLMELKQLFEHATTFGSLIQVPERLAEKLPALKQLSEANSPDMFVAEAHKCLWPLVQQAELLMVKYDAVVANPPYMGSGGMNILIKNFAKRKFPNASNDLFACFIERSYTLAKSSGFAAMVTMQSWMFLTSYKKMREFMLQRKTIISMAQIGYNSFPSMNSKVAQATVFSLMNCHLGEFVGSFVNLNDAPQSADKESVFLGRDSTIEFGVAIDEFSKVPGSPVAYWLGDRMRMVFEQAASLKDVCRARLGLFTGENDRYIRYWFEQNYEYFVTNDRVCQSPRWFPYNKGGAARKWSNNSLLSINWAENGADVKKTGTLAGEDCYFKEGITWGGLTSYLVTFRYSKPGYIFDSNKGPMMFPSKEQLPFMLGYLNSKIVAKALGALNPTLSTQNGDIDRLPFLSIQNTDSGQHITDGASKLLAISERDWDSYESSWDFQFLPVLVVTSAPTLESSYTTWIKQNRDIIAEMKRLEEENNRLFINAYGLMDELTPDVPIEQITLTVNPTYRYGCKLSEDELWIRFRQDTMEELLSYAIGCMMGRYSLDEPGLIYAHAANVGFDATRYQTFPADADGIVPLTDELWFEDDAANRIREFILAVWDTETLEENMTWLAESLGKRGNETPEETIRRYLSGSFFKDHLQIYKKRPIYWLFSSGKQGAFQALVYLHRYHEGTLARMRSEYVVPLTGKLQSRIEMLTKDAEAATSTAARNKLNKEIEALRKKHVELLSYDEKLRHYADMRIKLDLDDGVKVNYGKFGDLLAEVKAVTGGAGDE